MMVTTLLMMYLLFGDGVGEGDEAAVTVDVIVVADATVVVW